MASTQNTRQTPLNTSGGEKTQLDRVAVRAARFGDHHPPRAMPPPTPSDNTERGAWEPPSEATRYTHHSTRATRFLQGLPARPRTTTHSRRTRITTAEQPQLDDRLRTTTLRSGPAATTTGARGRRQVAADHATASLPSSELLFR